MPILSSNKISSAYFQEAISTKNQYLKPIIFFRVLVRESDHNIILENDKKYIWLTQFLTH